MRVLFLAHRLPYPPHKGEKIRALNILRFLGRRHEVYLGCLIDDAADFEHIEAMRSCVRGLVFHRIRPRLGKALALSAVLRSRSITVEYFYSKALQHQIDDLIGTASIDAVLCSSSPMAEYLFRSRHVNRLRSMRRIMDLIDVDSLKWRQYAEDSGPFSGWIYRHEARCLARFERRIAGEFDRVLVVSEQEKRHFPGRTGPGRLCAMSNGVDFEFFSPRSETPSSAVPPTLVFTGVMSYRPNIEGILWFVERILPRIQASVPDVQLYVVGSRPGADVRRLGRRAGVIVTGFVPDVRDYLSRASACIVPLRIARGVQNKILEAMSMGRPVIATRQAFEGIDAEPGRDIIVVEDETDFAEAAIGLLHDSAYGARIGLNARQRVKERYDWSANLRLLDELLPADDLAVLEGTLAVPLAREPALSEDSMRRDL